MSRLLKVFLCLGSQHYEPALLFSMAQLHRLQSISHPVWKMFERSPWVFNEEAGELSFSLLQRFTSKDTMRADFKHLDSKYKLISLFYDCARDFGEDLLEGGLANYFNVIEIDPEGDEVIALARHFMSVIEDMKSGRWTHYRPVKGIKKGPANPNYGKRAIEMLKSVSPEPVKVMYLDDTSKVFDEMSSKYYQSKINLWDIPEEWAQYLRDDVDEKEIEHEIDLANDPPSLDPVTAERKYEDDVDDDVPAHEEFELSEQEADEGFRTRSRFNVSSSSSDITANEDPVSVSSRGQDNDIEDGGKEEKKKPSLFKVRAKRKASLRTPTASRKKSMKTEKKPRQKKQKHPKDEVDDDDEEDEMDEEDLVESDNEEVISEEEAVDEEEDDVPLASLISRDRNASNRAGGVFALAESSRRSSKAMESSGLARLFYSDYGFGGSTFEASGDLVDPWVDEDEKE